MEDDARGSPVHGDATVAKAAADPPMILLDTHALVWMGAGRRRVRSLHGRGRLFVSPASLLEIQYLIEAGRLRLRARSLDAVVGDPRWSLDDPAAADWFRKACDIDWTRDPFDRLLVAHARIRNWRLATADDHLLDHLASSECFAL
jgi:PIN domain nuclease of toxin-antitoxin system